MELFTYMEDDVYQYCIKNAKENGLVSMCVTDHYDIDFPVQKANPAMDFYLDTDKYYAS